MPSVIRKKATQETTTSPITIQPIGSRFQLGTRFLVRGGRVSAAFVLLSSSTFCSTRQ